VDAEDTASQASRWFWISLDRLDLATDQKVRGSNPFGCVAGKPWSECALARAFALAGGGLVSGPRWPGTSVVGGVGAGVVAA